MQPKLHNLDRWIKGDTLKAALLVNRRCNWLDMGDIRQSSPGKRQADARTVLNTGTLDLSAM